MDFKEIAKKLNDAFEASGLSYGDLSERTGLAKSALHRYLSGDTKKIPIDRMTTICNAIGLDAKEVLGWEIQDDYERTARESAVPKNGEEVPKVAVFFKDYMNGKSPEFQEMVLRFLQAADGESFARAMKEENIKDLEDMINEQAGLQ